MGLEVALISWFWGLGLFCIKSSGQKTEGGEGKREKVEGKRLGVEDGFGEGRDSRWVGIFDIDDLSAI